MANFQTENNRSAGNRVEQKSGLVSSPTVAPSVQHSSIGDIVQLQRSIGNKAVGQLLQSSDPAAQSKSVQPVQKKENKTGLPDSLKSGLEQQSGIDLSDVKVHYNSKEPSKVQALAFAQGNDIHIGPGQERHLPHEGWHVVQQKQGRVQPKLQMKNGMLLNNNDGLEREADSMGQAALRMGETMQRHPLDAQQAASAPNSPQARSTAQMVVQRKVIIKFNEPEHEMEEFDTLTATIDSVSAERDKPTVATEDQSVDASQRSHVTSNVVFTSLFERNLVGKNWVEAWEFLKEQYQFLYDLLTRWYAEENLKKGSNAHIRKQLPLLIAGGIQNCTKELTRGSGNLPIGDSLWAARPKAGTSADWEYYDHQPNMDSDKFDNTTHFIKQWKPTLRDSEVIKLAEACETWITLRGQIPWTSVDEDSYIKGDAVGPRQVDSKSEEYAEDLDLSDGQAKKISKGIMKTFDFFPKSFTQKRTMEHAAAVAARHLVEHFQYHKNSISPNWRDAIKNQFLVAWKEKIEHEIETEKEKTENIKLESNHTNKDNAKRKRSNSYNDYGRPTAALEALQTNWTAVKVAFNKKYEAFKTAIK
ncbi:DUF4157 domain-containing protein [Paenibacillus sp. NEAU-GSW1]|uniref:eCIS core domain-containing protein n=1 Tax=Paenibacillus sp. NEAU-GSW1 TaxID=2682486 RepID=UPI001C12B171